MSELTAITTQQFAHKAWRRPSGYAFAARAHVLPVVVAELPARVPALPIGFVQAEARPGGRCASRNGSTGFC